MPESISSLSLDLNKESRKFVLALELKQLKKKTQKIVKISRQCYAFCKALHTYSRAKKCSILKALSRRLPPTGKGLRVAGEVSG